MGKNTPVAESGKSETFKKTLQGKLEQALEVLKDRYARDFPAFLKALEAYQATLTNLSAAGLKLAAELSRMGALYKNKYGESWGRLGQSMTELEAVRTQLVTNITGRFMSPMVKLLGNEKKNFATNEKKIKTTIATYEGDIERLISTLDKEQPAGTDRMLVNLGALSKKVTEFDNVNAEMLRDLQQSQQKQYIQWSEHWHTVVTSQLEFHSAMESKLAALHPLWAVGESAMSPRPEKEKSGDKETAAPAEAAPKKKKEKPAEEAPAPAPAKKEEKEEEAPKKKKKAAAAE